jgi:helix-turn-helix protein
MSGKPPRRRPARSYRVVDLVLRKPITLAPAEKLVLAAFGRFAKDDGSNARPALATVAKMVGLSLDEARRIVRRLVRSGWMRPIGNTHGGRGSPTQYNLDLAKIREAETLAPLQGIPGSETLATAPVLSEPETLASSTLNPCKNPPETLAPMQGDSLRTINELQRARAKAGSAPEAQPARAALNSNPAATQAEWEANRRKALEACQRLKSQLTPK